MMLKFFAWFTVFLCTTALSCWKLEGFPISKSQDFNLTEYVVQGHDIHVLGHADAGANRAVRSEPEAKGGQKDGYYEKYHRTFVSKKAKGGKGAYGGENVPHHRAKNAASSLITPPCFILTVTLLVIFTVIQSFPALNLNLF